MQKCISLSIEGDFKEIFLSRQTVFEGAHRIYTQSGFEGSEASVQEEFGQPVESNMWCKQLK